MQCTVLFFVELFPVGVYLNITVAFIMLGVSWVVLRDCLALLLVLLYFILFYFILTFIYFTSLRGQDEAYINSSRWSTLVGLELAYICM